MTKLVVAFRNFAKAPNKRRQYTLTEYFNLGYDIYTIYQFKFAYSNDANSRQELSGSIVIIEAIVTVGLLALTDDADVAVSTELRRR
jgi:hypothetical protein